VARSVGSVLNQTFRDYELIIINDASTDGSVQEVKKFNDPRIRLLYRDKPGPGGYAARNLGIKEARGKWIAFLDADDKWYPEHLWKMKELSIRYPEVYFMGSGWHNCTKETISEDSYYKLNKNKGAHILTAKNYLKSRLARLSPVWTSTACIRKDSPVAKNLFPADKQARRGGDLHAWLKMICRHKKMAWSPALGAVYYMDSVNRVSKTARSSPYLMSRKTCKELSACLDREEQKLLESYFNIRLKNAWVDNLKRGNPNFSILPKIYWRGSMPSVLPLVIISLLPSFILKMIAFYKK
jgi:glycosyltransferase involved in cell wall biosynthesis